MVRTIQGKRYLMRDKRPLDSLLKLYADYQNKYGSTPMHTWLVTRGKVYKELKNVRIQKRNPFGFTLDPRYVLRHGTVMKPSRDITKREAKAVGKVTIYKDITIFPTDAGFSTSLERESIFDTVNDAKGFIDKWKRNPANKKSAQDFQQSYNEHLDLVASDEFKKGSLHQRALMMTKVDMEEKAKNPFLQSAIEGLATGTGITLGASLMAPAVARSVKKALKGVSNPKEAKYIVFPYASRSQLTNWSSKTSAFKHAFYISHYTHTPIVVEKDDKILGIWKHGRKMKFKPLSKLDNPSLDDAAELSEQFHGRQATEILEVTESETSRENLTMLGCLTELEIAIDNRSVLPISFKTKSKREMVYLASDPKGKQLYIVGGNQSLDLDEIDLLGSDEKEKDFVTIGEVHSVSYFTDKQHLSGPESQKDGTEYWHVFGEEGGEKPVLVYDRLNARLSLVGGSYGVEGRGIVN